jgi:hypothetical protein
MASGLCHAVIDLMAYARPHFDFHQQKDEPARWLGPAHRQQHHEWYNAFGTEWDFDNPSPASLIRVIEHAGEVEGDEGAERCMSWTSHDYIDRVWDGLSTTERLYLEGMFVWVLEHPEVLLAKFGVDAFNERIARTVGGIESWEPAPGLSSEYRRLCRYAAAVVRQRPELRAVLEHYGQ